MGADYIKIGPNNSYNDVDKTSDVNYTIPSDVSSISVKMTTCGGGGGGGAHAFLDALWVNDHERAGGGGGSAGSGMTAVCSTNIIPILGYDSNSNALKAHFHNIAGATISRISVGKKGRGGAGEYEVRSNGEPSCTADAGENAGSSELTLRHDQNNLIEFYMYGGVGGGPGHAKASSVSGNREEDPGDGGPAREAYVRMTSLINGSGATMEILPPASPASPALRLLLDYQYTIPAGDYSLADGGWVSINISSSSVSLTISTSSINTTFTISCGPDQFYRAGSNGTTGSNSGGSGGSYTYANVSYAGGRGGDGNNDSLNGSDGSGASEIILNIDRNYAIVYPYIKITGNDNLVRVPAKVLYHDGSSFKYVSDILYRGEANNWINPKSSTYKYYDTGPI